MGFDIKFSLDDLSSELSEFKDKLEKYFREQIALGRTKEDVIKELENSKQSGNGIYYELIDDKSDRWKWVLQPCKIENSEGWAEWELIDNKILHDGDYEYLEEERLYCESCLYQASRGILPFDSFPIPGSQPTHGKSNCGQDCMCELNFVEE
jgi:hypothetical protein